MIPGAGIITGNDPWDRQSLPVMLPRSQVMKTCFHFAGEMEGNETVMIAYHQVMYPRNGRAMYQSLLVGLYEAGNHYVMDSYQLTYNPTMPE